MKMIHIYSSAVIALAFLLVLAGCAAPKAQPGQYRQMSMTEGYDLMHQERDYILLDVRTAQEYAQGHIPGAINIPNESIGSEKPVGLEDEDRLILVYCRSGNRSKQAAAKLVQLGYTNVVEIGGIIDWPGELEEG